MKTTKIFNNLGCWRMVIKTVAASHSVSEDMQLSLNSFVLLSSGCLQCCKLSAQGEMVLKERNENSFSHKTYNYTSKTKNKTNFHCIDGVRGSEGLWFKKNLQWFASDLHILSPWVMHRTQTREMTESHNTEPQMAICKFNNTPATKKLIHARFTVVIPRVCML